MEKTLYVLGKGKLSKKDGNILFEEEGSPSPQEFPIHQIHEIFILSTNEITYELKKELIDYQIVIHEFNQYDYYLGTFYPKESRFCGKTLLSEFEHYRNLDKRVVLAKAFISAGYKNMLRNLKYYQQRDKLENITQLVHYYQRITLVNTITELMMIEALIRKEYYRNFQDILNLDSSFHRHPQSAYDVVNQLITFVNSLLYAVIISEIHKTNLSGQVGFLHELGANRFALCYDISEIFKPIMVDRLVFRLLNKNIVTQDSINQEGRFSDEIIKVIFKHWDIQLNQVLYHRTMKRYVSYRNLIFHELIKLEKHIKGEKLFRPFVLWW